MPRPQQQQVEQAVKQFTQGRGGVEYFSQLSLYRIVLHGVSLLNVVS
jgi:hypothetical protein